MSAEIATIAPEIFRLVVAVCDYHVAQHAYPLAQKLPRDLRVELVELFFVGGEQRWQDRRYSFFGAPADAPLGRGERLENRRMRPLKRPWYDRNRLDDAVLRTFTPFRRC